MEFLYLDSLQKIKKNLRKIKKDAQSEYKSSKNTIGEIWWVDEEKENIGWITVDDN